MVYINYTFACTHMRSKTDRLRMFYLLLGEPMNFVDESNPYRERCLRKHFLFSSEDKRSEGKIHGQVTQTTKLKVRSQNVEGSG